MFVDPFEALDIPQTYEPPIISGVPPTDKMKKRLENWGIDCDREKLNFVKANKLIGEMIRRAENGLSTYRQCKWLPSLNGSTLRDGRLRRPPPPWIYFSLKKYPLFQTCPQGSGRWGSRKINKGLAYSSLSGTAKKKQGFQREFSSVKDAQDHVVKINQTISLPQIEGTQAT